MNQPQSRRRVSERRDMIDSPHFPSRGRQIRVPACGCGVIDGACRHLAKDRLQRSGVRWTLEGAQALLNLRALRQSSAWDQFHKQHESTHTRLIA